MARSAFIPAELKKRPFSLEEARAAGLTLSSLRSKAWRRIGSELYSWVGLRENPRLLLTTMRGLLPREAIFAGATAAWLLGIDVDPTDPVEVLLPSRSGIRSRPGLDVRRSEIISSEIVIVRGLRATMVHRALMDLCLRRPEVEALVVIDMAVCAGLTNAAELDQFAEAAKGRAGAGRLRSLAKLAAPAESPMETRLRWLLIQAGLPRPEVQMNLGDAAGRFVGRADLFYPEARLVVEYDGGNHRERLVEDNRRQNLLIDAGFRLMRFTAGDIHNRPDVVEAQVRGALAASRPSARLTPNARYQKPESARL